MRPPWLPELIPENSDWSEWVEELYKIYEDEFFYHEITYDAKRVKPRREPVEDEKDYSFYHLTHEGDKNKPGKDRIPVFDRCTRLLWIRAVIENCDDTAVEVYQTERRKELRQCFWFNEEYLVVLGVRSTHYVLVSAYCTDREHTRRKCRRDRDMYNKKLATP